MPRPETRKRPPPPLDPAALEQLALNYVGRYATTRKKLKDYLQRKVRQRGWTTETPAPIDQIVQKMAEARYVDDKAFAAAKSGNLLRRGYGIGRIKSALSMAGIHKDDAAPCLDLNMEDQVSAAIALAQRRKIGPFSKHPMTAEQQRKHIAILCRAGHSYDIARRIIDQIDDFIQ
jgi:regulatory protein